MSKRLPPCRLCFRFQSILFALAVVSSLGLMQPALACSQERPAGGDSSEPRKPDLEFREYFAAETQLLSDDCLMDLTSIEAWKEQRPELKRQLFEMLGLNPLPPKSDLKATVTQTVKGERFEVRSVHFQSRPGLYVTGNLYVPEKIDGKLPAILYLCGHGAVKKDGVSYGNKVHYHHHGAWFAQNGYVCLTIDSLQLGEIEGIHHGTHHLNKWWWLNRGYTPAGVEAWNCIRAIDYLQTLPEVDAEKIGVTGRSGGGAYSWWIAAIDERIKVAAPVAGITDLQNHVVDDCIEGHCDCMFMVNTYRWDYPLLAAMVAPRPLLISNSDRDRIFPLDGVYRTYNKARDVYQLYGKANDLGLHVTSGPHQDSQELRVHAFRWFNHYLKGSDALIRMPAEKAFEPEQLRVFQSLPGDSINSKISETFVASVETPAIPEKAQQWSQLKKEVMDELRVKTFGGWPREACDLNVKRISHQANSGTLVEEYEFMSQPGVTLTFRMSRRDMTPGVGGELPVRVSVGAWEEARLGDDLEVQVDFVPRGSYQTMNPGQESEPVSIHVRRRYYLLGQTLDGMRVYDIRRMIAAVREVLGSPDLQVELVGRGPDEQVMCAFAALFENKIARVTLPATADFEKESPYFLNVAKVLTPPMLAAMLGDNTTVEIGEVAGGNGSQARWGFPIQIDRLMERTSLMGDFEN